MKPESIICNAIIKSAEISLDRGSFLCVWLTLDYGDGSCQGFGGHVLGGVPDCSAGNHENSPNYAAEALVSIMRVCGVDKFSNIKGMAVRVKRAHAEFGGEALAVGHIIKDIWYEPGSTFKAWRNKS